MLELVDRPHQPGVAFLDEIQKRKPAVPVAFGDRDDQPQIAGGEFAFGRVIPLLEVIERAQPTGQRATALPRGKQQPAVLPLEQIPIEAGTGRLSELSTEILDAPADLTQLLQKRRETLDPQVHLLDQPDSLVALPHEPPPGGPPLLQRHTPRHGDAKEPRLFLFDEPERGKVRSQPLEKAGLFLRVGHRNLDGAIKADSASLHPLQQVHGTREDEVVGQHGVTKLPPPEFNLLGAGNLGGTGEQRVAAHLEQVEPNGVVDAGSRLPWPRGHRRPANGGFQHGRP